MHTRWNSCYFNIPIFHRWNAYTLPLFQDFLSAQTRPTTIYFYLFVLPYIWNVLLLKQNNLFVKWILVSEIAEAEVLFMYSTTTVCVRENGSLLIKLTKEFKLLFYTSPPFQLLITFSNKFLWSWNLKHFIGWSRFKGELFWREEA